LEYEIRNQKSEIRRKLEAQSSNFRILEFGFPSDFWLRISDFNTMTPFSYNPHLNPKGALKSPGKRVCISRAFQITPDGKCLPMPTFTPFLGRTRSIQELRRGLRVLGPVPKPFGRMVIHSVTVPR
jgi:hypothetical protein